MYAIKYTLQDLGAIYSNVPRWYKATGIKKNAERDSGVVEWCQDKYGIV